MDVSSLRALNLKFCPIPFSPCPLIRSALLTNLKFIRKFSLPLLTISSRREFKLQDFFHSAYSFLGTLDVLLEPVQHHLLVYILSRYVVVKVHGSWTEFREYFRQQEGEKRLLAFTKRGTNIHSDFSYRRGDWLVFGSETSGLPPEALLDCNREGMGGGTIRIPMVDTYVRCLNLSVSVGISLYEAARQLNYEQLQFPTGAASESQRLFTTEDIFG